MEEKAKMNKTIVANEITDVSEILISNQLITASEELLLLKQQLLIAEPKLAVEILENIISRCHVKDLGDIFIENIDQTTWWNKLNELKIKCKTLIREYQKGNLPNQNQ